MTAEIHSITQQPQPQQVVETSDETQFIAEATVRELPLWSLTLATILLILGILGVMGLDIAAIFHLLYQHSLDGFGNPTTSIPLLLIGSFITLAACFLTGETFKNPYWIARCGAIGLYLAILSFLVMNILPVYGKEIRALWGTSFAIGSGGLLSASTSTSEPPMWFMIGIATLMAIMYSTPGLLFVMLKRFAVDLIEKWMYRSEALDVLKNAEKIQDIRRQAKALRIAAESARDLDTAETAAKASVTAGLVKYSQVLHWKVKSNSYTDTRKVADSKQAQDDKAKTVLAATACLNQAQSITV